MIYVDQNGTTKSLENIVNEFTAIDPNTSIEITQTSIAIKTNAIESGTIAFNGVYYAGVHNEIDIKEFPPSNIDDMREDILQKPFYEEYQITKNTIAPYGELILTETNGTNANNNQFGLALKTYQPNIS